MSNFLAETEQAIAESGHTPADIVFIGSLRSGHRCTWDEFRSLANFSYDDGYGAAEIAIDLKVVFSDSSTMWRGEYDGSEWWEFSAPPQIPTESLPIRSFGGPGTLWKTLEELTPEEPS